VGPQKPPLTTEVGEPVTYVQGFSPKGHGADSVRFSNSPITRVHVKLTSSGRAGGSGLQVLGSVY